MNSCLDRYVSRAAAAGVEVEIIAPMSLSGRLGALLSECGASSAQAERVAALPATGWPQTLREEVASTLEWAGFQVESPLKTSDGFIWRRKELAKAVLGITFCELFLAETGSLLLAAGLGAGTLASLMPEIHLALSRSDGCRQNLSEYLSHLSGALPSRLTLVTGPSRTGDIELSMTKGVHGPKRVLHWILTSF